MFTMKILSPFSTYLTLIMLFNAATNNGLTSSYVTAAPNNYKIGSN